MTRVSVWVKPGSSADSIGWDPWRHRWVVSCRALPTGGHANRAVASLVANWLGLSPGAVHWTRAGSSPAKELTVEGLTDEEVTRRLSSRATEPKGLKPS